VTSPLRKSLPALALNIALGAGLVSATAAAGQGIAAPGKANVTAGTLWAWGDGNVLNNRQNGSGLVTGQLAGVVALAVGGGGGSGDTGYALSATGSVWAWGQGSNGELANATTTSLAVVPVAVHGLAHVVAIAGGGDTGYALEKNGTLWAWGAGSEGELGNGSDSTRVAVPVQVHGLTNVASVAGGGSNGYAVEKNGTVWAWGTGSSGQLGNGTTPASTDVPVQVHGLTNVVSVAGGGSDGYAVEKNGTVWAWGTGSGGQLGNGSDLSQSNVPVEVKGLSGVVAVAAFNGDDTDIALTKEGTVWHWGAGLVTAIEDVRLPAGSASAGSSVPLKVGGLAGIVAIAGGEDTEYAVAKNGTVWAWGADEDGELGNGSHNYVTGVPAVVPGLHGAVAVAGGYTDAYAILAGKG
jgi:alpha-tubulin suppressor-like RCC1 family protein